MYSFFPPHRCVVLLLISNASLRHGFKLRAPLSHKLGQLGHDQNSPKILNIMQWNTASLAAFLDHTYCMPSLSYFQLTERKSLLLSPNLVWSIRNTMSILHAPVWVQFISCLYCYKCWAHSKVDEMEGGPDTIYSAGRDMSPWLPNGFLHFTQLFPLRKSYRYRLPPCWPKKPRQHTDTVL